ncbi:hypothetical protein ACFL10_00900 [Patescibacteria group bacterium]
MTDKKRTPETASETSLSKDFLKRPELYAQVIGEMIQDGALDPNDIEKSPVLQECARRIQAMDAAKLAAAQEDAEEARAEVDKARTSLRAFSLIFEGEKPELIEMLEKLASEKDLEFGIIESSHTRIIGDDSSELDEDTVFFKNKIFAARCFRGYRGTERLGEICLVPYERAEEGYWQRMRRSTVT